MQIKRKEIIGIVLLLFALLSIICIFGYDITEQPSGLANEEKINTLLGIFGVYLAYSQFYLLG